MFLSNNADIGKVFGVKLIESSDMNSAIMRWDSISTGRPPWINPDDDIDTVNMAKHIADFRAKLTVLDIDIACSGSSRADYNQEIIKKLLSQTETVFT